MKKIRQTYEQRAEQFAKVCDIGIQVSKEAQIPQDEKEDIVNMCLYDQQMALHPSSMYKKIGSLKCIEAEHFWYWNEHDGKHVNEFWIKVKEAGLEYERKDLFKRILKRGKISNMQEYDYVIDGVLIGEQTGRISLDEVNKLNNYLFNYEKSRRNKAASK